MPWLFLLLSAKRDGEVSSQEEMNQMNKKAEVFKQYLAERNIDAFLIDDTVQDELEIVIFRSHLAVQGHELPVIVVLDNSIYGMIRLLVASNAVHDGNELAVLKLLNHYNAQCKSFTYYLDEDGDLMMDACVLSKEGEADGDMIYAMFQAMADHLTASYAEMMQTILQ